MGFKQCPFPPTTTRHGKRVLRVRPLPPADGRHAGLDGRHALPLHLGSHGQTQGRLAQTTTHQ